MGFTITGNCNIECIDVSHMYKHVGLIGRSYKENLHGNIGEYRQGRIYIFNTSTCIDNTSLV